MKFFSFGEKNKDKNRQFALNAAVKKDDWRQVFSACLGKMTAIQLACGTYVVKNNDWNVDFSRGTISFGEMDYPIQFIGSESNTINTWLWGWENINQFEDQLLWLAEETKRKGEQWGLAPLVQAEQVLTDEITGHNFSIVACGICDKPLCYYRCMHDAGAAFVAFSGVPEEVFAPIDFAKFIDITMQCIQRHNVDHKIFVEHFLQWNQTSFHWEETILTADFTPKMQIYFEQAGDSWRIEKMESK